MVTLPRVAISNSTIFTVNATNNYWEARAGPTTRAPTRAQPARPYGQRDLLAVVDDEQRAAYGSDGGVRAGGNGAVSVSWTAPALSGTSNATIASYTVSASGGGVRPVPRRRHRAR